MTQPTQSQLLVDQHQKYLRERRQGSKLGGTPAKCNHGVTWTECANCSRRA